MIGYNSMEPPDTQPTTVCRECGGDFSVAEDDPGYNLDGEYTCEDCETKEEREEEEAYQAFWNERGRK